MDFSVKIGVVIENPQQQILLIREQTEKVNEPRWNIIKGTYGDHEQETLFQAAIRECREEASVAVDLTHALPSQIEHNPSKTRVQFNFIAQIISGTPQIATISEQESRNEKITEIRWFDRHEIQKLSAEDIISTRVYEVIQSYLRNERFDLSSIQQL